MREGAVDDSWRFEWVAGLAVFVCLLAGCGDATEENVQRVSKFKGTEVQFREDGDGRHFIDESSQMTSSDAIVEERVRYIFTASGSGTEDEIEIGVAGVQAGTYRNENIKIAFRKDIEGQKVGYESKPDGNENCPEDGRVTIEGEQYGLTLGTFSATVCTDDEGEPGPSSIPVGGEFATWLDKLDEYRLPSDLHGSLPSSFRRGD